MYTNCDPFFLSSVSLHQQHAFTAVNNGRFRFWWVIVLSIKPFFISIWIQWHFYSWYVIMEEQIIWILFRIVKCNVNGQWCPFVWNRTQSRKTWKLEIIRIIIKYSKMKSNMYLEVCIVDEEHCKENYYVEDVLYYFLWAV